jgi:hypothetical protein
MNETNCMHWLHYPDTYVPIIMKLQCRVSSQVIPMLRKS